MPDRMIRSQGGTNHLKDTLVSLLALEASLPSQEVFVVSPWVGNAQILDNRFSHYSDLFPFVEGKIIYLSDVLRMFSWKGSKVKVICDPSLQPSKSFYSLMSGVEGVEFRSNPTNHAKGLFTDHFHLHGSMNLTHSGIYLRGEHIRVTYEPSDVALAMINARALWGESTPL